MNNLTTEQIDKLIEVIGKYHEIPHFLMSKDLDEMLLIALEMAKGNAELDEGVPLPKSVILDGKKPFMERAHNEGLSARMIGRILDISHETVSRFVSTLPTPPKETNVVKMYKGCEVCEYTGRIEVEPDSLETHPCDDCEPRESE